MQSALTIRVPRRITSARESASRRIAVIMVAVAGASVAGTAHAQSFNYAEALQKSQFCPWNSAWSILVGNTSVRDVAARMVSTMVSTDHRLPPWSTRSLRSTTALAAASRLT